MELNIGDTICFPGERDTWRIIGRGSETVKTRTKIAVKAIFYAKNLEHPTQMRTVQEDSDIKVLGESPLLRLRELQRAIFANTRSTSIFLDDALHILSYHVETAIQARDFEKAEELIRLITAMRTICANSQPEAV